MTALAFYLSEGTHTLRLEVTTGEYAADRRPGGALVTRLNAVYRQVLMITGISPDMYRDYEFEKLIPDTLTEMASSPMNFGRSATRWRRCPKNPPARMCLRCSG